MFLKNIYQNFYFNFINFCTNRSIKFCLIIINKIKFLFTISQENVTNYNLKSYNDLQLYSSSLCAILYNVMAASSKLLTAYF
jgi:hypothetical protein